MKAPAVYADSLNYTITVAVQPSVNIVVTKTFIIEKIISNSAYAVMPIVHVDSMNGLPVPLQQSVYSQYLQLTDNTKTIKDGVVYSANSQNAPKTYRHAFSTGITDLTSIYPIHLW